MELFFFRAPAYTRAESLSGPAVRSRGRTRLCLFGKDTRYMLPRYVLNLERV